MKDGPELGPAGNEEMKGLQSQRVLQIDIEKYQTFLDETDLNEDQKRDVIEALWQIIVAFVDLGFGVHPVQQACGQLEDCGPKIGETAEDLLGLDHPLTQRFEGAAETAARKESDDKDS